MRYATVGFLGAIELAAFLVLLSVPDNDGLAIAASSVICLAVGLSLLVPAGLWLMGRFPLVMSEDAAFCLAAVGFGSMLVIGFAAFYEHSVNQKLSEILMGLDVIAFAVTLALLGSSTEPASTSSTPIPTATPDPGAGVVYVLYQVIPAEPGHEQDTHGKAAKGQEDEKSEGPADS